MRRIFFFLLFLFTFLPLPAQAIASFTPVSGPVATVVTITGWNFTGASDVAFNATPCVSFIVVSDTQIKAAVPWGATTGPITVGLATTFPVEFTVTTPMPRLTSYSPSSGFVGTVVNVTGTGISTATDVTFNGVPASFYVVGPTQLRATVPAGATTGPIAVTTPMGTASTAPFKFTVR